MQAGGAARGAGAIPGRGRLEVLLAVAAVVAVTAIVAFLMWMPPLATSGVEDAARGKVAAGSAIVHDDAGNIYPGAGSAVLHDDAGNVRAN